MTASIADWAKHMHLCTQTLGRIKMKVRCEQEIESQLKLRVIFLLGMGMSNNFHCIKITWEIN